MTYPGGKNGSGAYQTIINLMPPHDTYIEPFLGGGAIMRHKRPAARNIGIDNDPEALKFFTVKNGGTRGVTLHHGDAFGFLERHPFTSRDFVYCDPPYLHDTRVKLKLYRDEWPIADHQRLLDILKSLPCMVMISGYGSALYDEVLKDWNTITYQAMTRGGTQATEWLWFNYPHPTALHDYRYLGADYRERERIKRKKQRWINKLTDMPLLERQALLSAMEEAWPQLTPSETAVLPATPSQITVLADTAENNGADPTPLKMTVLESPIVRTDGEG